MALTKYQRLWHDDIHTFLLSLGFTQCSADPNLYLGCDGILILPYVDDISMSCLDAGTKAAIEFKAKFLEKCNIKNLGAGHQCLGFEIHRDNTGISLGPNTYTTTILRQFTMEPA